MGAYENIDEIMDLLYDRNKGIGLNTYRYNVGAGYPTMAGDKWRGTTTLETSPGKYELSRDKNAIRIFKAAMDRGAINNTLFINSPPARMTISGYVSGEYNGKPNLSKEYEDEFAQYCVNIAKLFLNKGYPIKYISPINEPQWLWGQDNDSQEGCHYKIKQIIRLGKKIIEKIENERLPVKLSLIESGKWDDKKYTYYLYKKLIKQKQILRHINHFSCHSYWTSEPEKKKAAEIFNSMKIRLPLYQTEWCHMENKKDLGMDSALLLAKTLHDDLTILSVVSWSFWLGVSKYNYNDGLLYINVKTRSIEQTKRLWALGNYSRFIKQGYERIELPVHTDNIYISAYKNNNIYIKKYVIVAINMSSKNETLTFEDLENNQVEVYITDKNNNCGKLYEKIYNLKEYIIPEKSIVTFIIKK